MLYQEKYFADVYSYLTDVYFSVNFFCSSSGLCSSWSFGLLGIFELFGSLTKNRRLL